MGISNWLLKRHIKKAIKDGLRIGSDYYIHSRVDFGSEPYLIIIGNHVRIAAGVRFITHDGGVWVLRQENRFKNADVFGSIIIGNNVHIGSNAIIMPNVTVGDNVVIGCAAVVTRNIPSNSVVAGVPARVIETLDEYKQKTLKRCVNTHNMSFTKKKEYLLAHGDNYEKDSN